MSDLATTLAVEAAYREATERAADDWRDEIAGVKADLDAALDMLSALIDGRTTPESAKEWLRLNYPKRS